MRNAAKLGIVAGVLSLVAAGGAGAWQAQSTSAAVTGVVYKNPTCGCCVKWIDQMRAAGFALTATDSTEVGVIKDQHGVPPRLRSCHTSVIGGYIFEGHVPVDLVQKVLRDKPAGVTGIAVPGMPLGSPGMEVPSGAKDPYQVIAFDKAGSETIYATR